MKKIFLTCLLLIPFTLMAQWNVVYWPSTLSNVLAVPSDSNIFITMGSKYISYSHNGGKSWNQFETEYEYEFLEDMDFVSDSIGYTCGGGWFSPHRNIILKTTDAGITWQTITRDSLGQFQFVFSQIDFVNKDTGMVIGAYGDMFRTFDGGVSWQEIYLATNQQFSHSDLCLVNDSVGFITTNSNITTNYKSRIYKTTDMGTTWQIVKEWDSLNSFLKIHFVNAQIGYVGGTNGKIFKTTDGGTTWIDYTVPPGNTINALWFTSPTTGYSNAIGTVSITTNGGNSWAPQLMNPPGIVTNIQFSPSTQSGFLVAGNLLYKTTNSGGVTSIPLPQMFHPFQMYPNPASKVVHIDYLKEKTVYSIQLIDITGRVIKAFPKDEKILQVADVTRGTYFLLIETREGWVKEKLVLQ